MNDHYDPPPCPSCSGSGEGHYDGSKCWSCGGSGIACERARIEAFKRARAECLADMEDA